MSDNLTICEEFSSPCNSNQFIPSTDCVDNINNICDEYLCNSPSNTEFLSTDEQSDIEELHNENFIADIIEYVKEFKHSAQSVNALLQILRKYTNAPFPKDCRTLLKTPTYTEVNVIDKGQYWHCGLEKAITRLLMNCTQTDYLKNRNIDFLINIDGAILGKSTEKGIWPILCSDTISKNVAVTVYFMEKENLAIVIYFLKNLYMKQLD